MILIEKTKIVGLEPTIRGMRNPMNSWAKSDSIFTNPGDEDGHTIQGDYEPEPPLHECGADIGPNDLDLMLRLAKAGSVDGKFRRMIAVYVDITAPLYWWKEFDTYKVGTVANSCSTMHKIHAKEFTLDDFSHEHLSDFSSHPENVQDPLTILSSTIKTLNSCRECYLKEKDKFFWWQMIQLLPSSYNQKRTVMLNYEVLSNIYQHRRNHKLDEWRELCKWIEGLPYSEVISCNAIEGKKAALKTFVDSGAFDKPTEAERKEIQELKAAVNKLRAQKWSEEQITKLLQRAADHD